MKSFVFSARDADKGSRGKIAYVETKNNKILQKLMAMGVLPGVPVEVMQTFPAFVLAVGKYPVGRRGYGGMHIHPIGKVSCFPEYCGGST